MPTSQPLTGLRIFFWLRVTDFITGVAGSWLLLPLLKLKPSSFQWYFLGEATFGFLLALVAFYGLWRFRSDQAEAHGVRGLGDLALYCFAGAQLFYLSGMLLQTFLGFNFGPFARLWYLPGLLADVAVVAAVALAAQRASGQVGTISALAYGAAGARLLGAGLSVARLWLPYSRDLTVRVTLMGTGLAISAVSLLCLGLLVHRRSHELAAAAGGEAGEESSLSFDSAPWPSVLAGIRAYRAALLARLLIAVGALLLAFMARAARSVDGAKLAMVGGVLASLFIGVWMLSGLIRYARVPRESGAQGAAVTAVSLAIVGLLLELYSVFLVSQVYSSSYRALRQVATRLPWMQAVGLALGVFAAVALLVSLGRLSRHLVLPELVRRVGQVIGVLVIVAVGNVVLRAILAARPRGGTAVVLALGGGVLLLGLAIWGLVGLFRILDGLRDKLLSGSSTS